MRLTDLSLDCGPGQVLETLQLDDGGIAASLQRTLAQLSCTPQRLAKELPDPTLIS